MNRILSLTVLSLAFAWGFGADTDKVLPKAASDVVAELNASKTTATLKAIKKLQVVMGDLTRKGDLDAANATKTVMDGLQKGLDAANSVDADNSNVVGNWNIVYSDGLKIRHQFSKDGKVSANNGLYDGTWKIEEDKLIVEMTWHDNSRSFTFALPIAPELSGQSMNGIKVKMVKIK